MRTKYDLIFLQECLELRGGKLFWKRRPAHHFETVSKWQMFNTKYAGCEAGNLGKRGYLRFNLSGKYYLCHRVIFYFVNGYLPGFIDHRDGDRLNNLPDNLREATQDQNSHNTKVYKGTSKYKGVSWSKDKSKWRVYCTDKSLGKISNGKYKQLYIGQTLDEINAALMYDEAAKEVYGEFAWLNSNNFIEVEERLNAQKTLAC